MDVSSFLERAKTFEGDECLHWPFMLDRCGYGRCGKQYGDVLAHRVVCRAVNGQPSEEAPNALHSCNNRSCVNPRHLRWGNQSANREDMRVHGTLPVGEGNGASKLSEDAVRRMRDLRGQGWTQRRLAAHFGVGVATVCKAVNGGSWAHVA